MKRYLIAALIVARAAWAVGTCTITGPTPIGNTVVFTQGTAWSVIIACTGDASTGSFPATPIPGLISNTQLQGYVLSQIEVVPGGTAPTPGFSITVTDANGSDQLSGQATNLGASGAQAYAVSASRVPINGTLTLNITGNSVASAAVTTTLWLTAPNITPYAGRAVVEKGTRWSGFSQPAVSSQATFSRAAAAGVRHVADCISLSSVAGPTTAPVVGPMNINLRDGATGAGTVLWTTTIQIIATASVTELAPFSVCGLALIGSPNTAMTLEFSAALANLAEVVSLSGYDLE